MKANAVRNPILTIIALVAFACLPLQASSCSNTATAGDWAYTYTGTIFTPSGPLPAASVGHYHQDTTGNISGSQARSVAGNSAVEETSGLVIVNADCTATATINVLVNGQLQRTAQLAVVYDENRNHARMIFESLTLPDSTNIPVVLAIDASKISSRVRMEAWRQWLTRQEKLSLTRSKTIHLTPTGLLMEGVIVNVRFPFANCVTNFCLCLARRVRHPLTPASVESHSFQLLGLPRTIAAIA